MRKLFAISLILCVFISCKSAGKEKIVKSDKTDFQEVKHDDYELSKPNKGIEGVLVLFGGYPEKAEDIKREFNVLDDAKKKNIAIVFMNYNQKLWLEESEKQKLAEQLQGIFEENDLPKTNIYFGGFSSGGNVAMLMSDFLSRPNSEMKPKGVFVVDSPIDLMALHKSSEKNVERNYSEASVQESNWIIQTLGKQRGDPLINISNYEKYSVYTSETNNFDNIKRLKNLKIRLYSEPDTIWWKQNRMADLDQMNAYYLERLSALLKTSGFEQTEYIATENKGYRANGERHPHEGVSQRTEEFYLDGQTLILAVIEDNGAGEKGKTEEEIDKLYYFHEGEIIKEVHSSNEAEYGFKNSDGEELLSEVNEYLEIYTNRK